MIFCARFARALFYARMRLMDASLSQWKIGPAPAGANDPEVQFVVISANRVMIVAMSGRARSLGGAAALPK